MAQKTGISKPALVIHVILTLVTGGTWLLVLIAWALLKYIKK